LRRVLVTSGQAAGADGTPLAAGKVAAELEATIEAGDVPGAAAAASALGDGDDASSRLARIAAARDSEPGRPPSMRIAVALLGAHGRSRSAGKGELLAALGAHLATPAERRLAEAWSTVTGRLHGGGSR